MCKFLGDWWRCMIHFARRLAALALTYGIKLMDVQEKCEVYLIWHFSPTDYIDNKNITSVEHVRKLLKEITEKKPKNKQEKPKSTRQKKQTDLNTATPTTLKYYTHGNNGILMKQRKRVDLIFKK